MWNLKALNKNNPNLHKKAKLILNLVVVEKEVIKKWLWLNYVQKLIDMYFVVKLPSLIFYLPT